MLMHSTKKLITNSLVLLHGATVSFRYQASMKSLNYSYEGKVKYIYDKLRSGDWSWEAQVHGFKCFFDNVLIVLQTLLPDGTTLVPVILSDKTAYPIYLTICNILKSISHKPSFHTQKLIGYFPTISLDGTDILVDSACLTCTQLFHYAMFPVLAAYVADYPEQALVMCTCYTQMCPKCFVTKDELGNHVTGDPQYQKESICTIHHTSQQSTRVRADAAVRDHGLNLIFDPFWIELLHCNIHDAITPDILHQIYQGLVRHLCGWISTLISDAELDACFKCMPHAHSIHLFSYGISGLIQISSPEHRKICKQLLGCIVDAPGAPTGVIHATHSLLYFLEITQYQSHTEATLGYLTNALDEFHANKDVFINLGAHNSEDFNFAKLHSLKHYANSICHFGMTNNYNTEATEHLHINYATDEMARATQINGRL
ncbi:hypothetical protein BDR04DRAFT_1127998 [Suillus decipiens]|nr:hypothetical protein BDR04DRAFT_1127998 [Suillus decipiens]